VKKIFIFLFIVSISMFILPQGIASAADVEIKETDNSFGEEGGHAYDSVKDNIWNHGDEAMNELFEGVKSTGESIVESDPIRAGWVFIFHIYDVVAAIYPGALVISLSVGFLTAMLSSKNKKRRKRAVLLGLITIPVMLTLFVYVLPYLYLKFA